MEDDALIFSAEARWTFRIYAALTGAVGFLLFSWGPMWLGTDLPGLPFHKAALVRTAGGVLMAVACFAYSVARIPDSEAQHKAMLWFGIGHAVIFLVLMSQQMTIWQSPQADRVMFAPFLIAVAFFFLWSGAEVGPQPDAGLTLLSIFRNNPQSRESLRLRYQDQIRQAALQEERHRLARDLHDSVKQQIFAIQTSAATVQARFDNDPEGARTALDQLRTSARDAMGEMEAMLDQLRAAPLENTGLVAALKQQCEALGYRTGAQVDFEVGKLPPNFALAPGAQESLFRIAQEALANVARHARASHVRVVLAVLTDRLKLVVQDDGAGFDTDSPRTGMGLANMRARAGEFGATLAIASSSPGGTTIDVEFPLAAEYKPEDYNPRLYAYAGAAIAHFVMFIVRRDAYWAVLGIMWTAFFARVSAARSIARRAKEAVR